MTKNFWNDEYKNPKHLKISDKPSGDMISFVRWAKRNSEWDPFPRDGMVLDIGCGNGRNIIAITKEFNMRGFGIDISDVAVDEAIKASKKLNIKYAVQSVAEPIPLQKNSVDVILDMMTSHFLKEKERKQLLKEVLRVLKPYGWFFFKSFVLEGDSHAKRLLSLRPGKEKNTYVHPRIEVEEHVWTIEEIKEFFSPHFTVHKIIKSHKHIIDGKPGKRRTVSVYLEKRA